jgi:DNA-binding CsgD family transcriptional regulator
MTTAPHGTFPGQTTGHPTSAATTPSFPPGPSGHGESYGVAPGSDPTLTRGGSSGPRPANDPWAGGRRMLVNALLRHEHWQAEAHLRLLLAQGHSLSELFDQVLLPLVDQRRDMRLRGAAGAADLSALQQTVVRLVHRVPMSTTPRNRGSVLVTSIPGDDKFLTSYALSCSLEHQGFAVFNFGDLPVRDLPSFAHSQPDTPKVVALTLDEPPSDLPRMRAELRRLRSDLPSVRIVVVGRASRQPHSIAAAIGADGAAIDVAGAVRLVETLLQPLTAREIETLRLVAGGRTNRQIATALGIAPSTVKSSLDRVFDKLHTPDRAAAAALAVRRGWID